jgi:hypothetical protein
MALSCYGGPSPTSSSVRRMFSLSTLDLQRSLCLVAWTQFDLAALRTMWIMEREEICMACSCSGHVTLHMAIPSRRTPSIEGQLFDVHAVCASPSSSVALNSVAASYHSCHA